MGTNRPFLKTFMKQLTIIAIISMLIAGTSFARAGGSGGKKGSRSSKKSRS